MLNLPQYLVKIASKIGKNDFRMSTLRMEAEIRIVISKTLLTNNNNYMNSIIM